MPRPLSSSAPRQRCWSGMTAFPRSKKYTVRPSKQEIHSGEHGGGLMSSREMNAGQMNLDQLQRAVFDVVRQPLTEDERMREQTLDGRSTRAIAEQIIKPNDRLTSVERLEIYN